MKYIKEVTYLAKQFTEERNNAFNQGDFYNKTLPLLKEVNILADTMIDYYCRCFLECDFESAKILMNVAEETSHMYEGKYGKGLLEDIMREERDRRSI